MNGAGGLAVLLAVSLAASARAQPPAPTEPAPEAATAPSATAPTAPAAELPHEYGTVVSTTRSPATIREATTSSSVIDRRQIDTSPSLSTDVLLRSDPSVAMFRRSASLAADPTSQGINLRGLGPSAVSRTLVLWDGVPLNDAFGGWVYWRAVPRLGLDRIEVVPGGGSALWGDSALGGVVHLVSRPIDGLATDADASFGTFRTLDLAARGAERWGRLAASLEAGFLRSDGYPVVAPWVRGPIDGNTPSLHGSVNGRVDFDPTSDVHLTARASWFREELNGGTKFTTSAVGLGQASLGVHAKLPGASTVDASVFARFSRFDQQRGRANADRSDEQLSAAQHVPANEQGASIVWSAPSADLLGMHHISLGADFRRVAGLSSEDLFPAVLKPTSVTQRTTGGEQQSGGVFVQDLWALSAKLAVSGALRVDAWRNVAGLRNEERMNGDQSQTAYDERTNATFSPSLGLRFRPVPALALKLSGSRGFRAPTLNELYRPFQVGTVLTAANPSLGPETLWGAEAGAEVDGPVGLHARATGFWNEWQSPIVNVTLDQPLPTGETRERQNLGSARARGAELAVDWSPLPVLNLRLGYTYVDSRVTSAPSTPDLVGKRLPQDPVHRAVAAITFDDPRLFTALVQLRFVGPQYEDDLNTLEMAGCPLLDASLGRRIVWQLEAFAAAENLLNRTCVVGRAGIDTIGQPFAVRVGLRLRQR